MVNCKNNDNNDKNEENNKISNIVMLVQNQEQIPQNHFLHSLGR